MEFGTKLKYRFVVTGGNGFIGTNFIKLLLGDTMRDDIIPSDVEISVVNVDKMTYAANTHVDDVFGDDPRYRKVEKDINDVTEEDLGDFDFLVNFAAESHVDNSILGPSVFTQTNVLGTIHLLELCKNIDRHVKFLQVSTDEVYGSCEKVYGSCEKDEDSFHEKSETKPSSPYSASKAGADAYVMAYARTYGEDYELATYITRCSNNYGLHQHPEKFLPKIISNTLQDKKIPIYGNGLQERDWIHVVDHCRGILFVLVHGEENNIYNIGCNNPMKNIELACIVLKALKKSSNLIEHVDDRLGHDRRYAIDSKKIRKLGWKPMYNFNFGVLNSLINHYALELNKDK